jgi:hypothetical protein
MYAEREGNYWRSQLVRIKAGETWQPIVGINADGTFKLGTEREPTALDEEQVRTAMNQCIGANTTAQSQLQQFAVSHQQRIQKDLGDIKQEMARRFAWEQNPEILENTMTIPGMGERSVKDIRNDFINLFPPYMRSNIGVTVASNMWVGMQIYAAQIRELQSQKQVAEVKVEEVKRGEPTGSTRAPDVGKPVNGVKTFSMEGFPVT